MYHKTEIFTCDRCGVPLLRSAQEFRTNITREEAATLRGELEKQAEAQVPAGVRSFLGVTNLIRLPECVTLHFCEPCMGAMMPDLPTWRRKAVSHYVERFQQQREDAEEVER